MKIFAMNDCDWMAAESAEEAVAEYVKNYSGDEFEDGQPHELTEEEMDGHILHGDEDDDGESDCTFREGLEKMIADGVQFPTFFASTEY